MGRGETQAAPGVRAAHPITLLTDFGLRDTYVAAMKGVLLRLAPQCPIVDLCHEVPPGDIQAGGLLWAQAVRWFPPGCIHVAVVDPGVGTRRRIVAAAGLGSIFLAPDNGLLGHVLRPHEVRAVHAVRCARLYLKPVSSTFHGRDIFAPVAAALGSGLLLERVGPRIEDPVRGGPPPPAVRFERLEGRPVARVRGQVIRLDRFGNAVTSVRPRPGWQLTALEVRGLRLDRQARTYSSGAPGAPLALVGSAGYLEIAVRDGDAASRLGLAVGDPVRCVFALRG